MMGSKTLFLSALSMLAASVAAQTPGGFSPNQQQTMGVTFGSNSVEPAGELLTRTETANAPSISSIALGQSTTGLIMMIDLDAGSSSNRQPRLHWLAPGITPNLQSPNGASLNIPVPSSNGAPYAGPNPPAGDSAHRYVLLLFTQPSSFSIPSSYGNLADNRGNFNYNQFITDLRLGSPLAANYFTVQNTGSSSSSSSGAGGSSSTSSASGSSSSATGTGSRTSSASGTMTASSVTPIVTQSGSPADAAAVVNGQAVLGMAAAGLLALL